MKFGQHGLKLDVEGVDALVQGALAFDHFDRNGMEISNDALLELSSSEFAARSAGRLLTVSFDNARGIAPGETKVCYLGQPIGLVESIQPSPSTGLILAAVRLIPEYEHLADTAATFTHEDGRSEKLILANSRIDAFSASTGFQLDTTRPTTNNAGEDSAWGDWGTGCAARGDRRTHAKRAWEKPAPNPGLRRGRGQARAQSGPGQLRLRPKRQR
jgi:hypothetical protein